MFLTHQRYELRQFYQQCWQKMQQGQPLEALEKQVAEVIQEHPEYHAYLQSSRDLDKDFRPEEGQINPFLHMGLHIALREQAGTDRPPGIRTVYQQLAARYGQEKAEHMMMDCLVEALWQNQRYGSLPDEQAYLEHLRELLP